MANTGREYHTQQTHYLRKAIDYTDTSTVTVGRLPAGACVVDANVTVTTAWDSGTSDVLDIGTTADGDGFATDLSLQTAGKIVADELATSDDLYSTSETDVTCAVASVGTAATAGAAIVQVFYTVDNDG